jgi:hypothetical protein
MSTIEVNLAGFQFVRCVPDVPGGGDRRAWHVSRVHQMPLINAGRRMRRWVPRLRAA